MRCPDGEGEPQLLYRFPPSDMVRRARELIDEIEIFRCPGTGLIYSNVRDLTIEELASLYDEDLFTSQDYWKSVTLDQPETSEDYHLYQWTLDRLPPAGDEGRLLDVGCGLGIFLAAAKQQGWQVEGTELSEYAAKYIEERLGCAVHLGELEQLPLAAGSFDVVAGWDVLEHVRDVHAVLARCRELLKPEGHLVIRTINENALVVAISGLIYRLTGGRVYQLARRTHEIYHLTYFTHQTLARLLSKYGFELVDRRDFDIPVQRLGLSPLLRPAMRVLYALQSLTNRHVEQLVIARRTAE